METKQKTLAELISKFENGNERYHKSAIFKKVIDSLIYGADELSIINDLLTVNEDQQKAFEDYVRKDVRPLGVMLTKEAAELYASEENRKKDEPKQSSPVSLEVESLVDLIKKSIPETTSDTPIYQCGVSDGKRQAIDIILKSKWQSQLQSRVNTVDPKLIADTDSPEWKLKVCRNALEIIQDYQMNYVQLARTTKIYQIAEEALNKTK